MKWTPLEKEQIFKEALHILRTDWEGSIKELWTKAQMTLPTERQYPEFSNSYPTFLTMAFKLWRKTQPGPHDELAKLPNQNRPKKIKKILTHKQRSRIARKAVKARWAAKRAAAAPVIKELNFCPQCGTPRNTCGKCGFNFLTVKFAPTV